MLWLCGAYDDEQDPEEQIEPPVPGGLAECLDSGCGAMLDFFGLEPLILVAAAEGAPAPPVQQSQEDKLASWIEGLENDKAQELLRQLLCEDTAAVKAQTLAAIGQSQVSAAWPAANLKRSLMSLIERADNIRTEREAEAKRKQEAAALRKRQKRMKEMVQDPAKWLSEANSRVQIRGPENYAAAADILLTFVTQSAAKKAKRLLANTPLILLKRIRHCAR